MLDKKFLKSVMETVVYVRCKDSSRTQILNVNRPSNHPSTTKTRPQVKQARLPTKTAFALGRPISVTKFSVRSSLL